MGPEETKLFNKLKEARERGVIGINATGSFDKMSTEEYASLINKMYGLIDSGAEKRIDWNCQHLSTLQNKITLNGNIYNLKWEKHKDYKYIVSCFPKEADGECFGFGNTPAEAMTELESRYIDLIDFIETDTEDNQ